MTGARRRTARGIPVALYGPRRGTVTLLCAAFALFTLIPIARIMINSTKTQANIFESFGFWFQRPFVHWHNFVLLFQNVDGYGTYFQWSGNTALYALLGGGGATVDAVRGDDGAADLRGHRVEQLLPATDHLQQEQPVPADRRHRPVV